MGEHAKLHLHMHGIRLQTKNHHLPSLTEDIEIKYDKDISHSQKGLVIVTDTFIITQMDYYNMLYMKLPLKMQLMLEADYKLEKPTIADLISTHWKKDPKMNRIVPSFGNALLPWDLHSLI